jgi:hypothetical protein
MIYQETFFEYHYDQVMQNYDYTKNLEQNNNLGQKLRLKANKKIYFFCHHFVSTDHVDQHMND